MTKFRILRRDFRDYSIKLGDFFEGDDLSVLMSLAEIAMDHGSAYDHERLLRRGKRGSFPAQIRLFKIEEPEKVYLALEVQDLSLHQSYIDLQRRDKEFREAQQEVLESSKWSSLGQMAAGIAHEIKNPLAVINTLVFGIEQRMDMDPIDMDLIRERLGKIKFHTKRIVNIINTVRTLSVGDKQTEYESENVVELIDDSLVMCDQKIKFLKIDFQKIVPSENIFVACNRSEISQIIINLVNNSCDAIETERNRWIKLTVGVVGEKVLFKVIDSGPGIPGDVREKIMEPFFSTKGPKKGTGIGLSISRKLADAHGGRLELAEKAENTTFVLTLPLAEKKASAA